MNCSECDKLLLDWTYFCRVCKGAFCAGCLSPSDLCGDCEEADQYDDYYYDDYLEQTP